MKPKFEIINHGFERAQYFQGQGTAFTEYDYVVTGCGSNAKEAYEDAVEQIYRNHNTREVDCLHLPTRPRGINAKDSAPARLARVEENEWWSYVSILYSL